MVAATASYLVEEHEPMNSGNPKLKKFQRMILRSLTAFFFLMGSPIALADEDGLPGYNNPTEVTVPGYNRPALIFYGSAADYPAAPQTHYGLIIGNPAFDLSGEVRKLVAGVQMKGNRAFLNGEGNLIRNNYPFVYVSGHGSTSLIDGIGPPTFAAQMVDHALQEMQEFHGIHAANIKSYIQTCDAPEYAVHMTRMFNNYNEISGLTEGVDGPEGKASRLFYVPAHRGKVYDVSGMRPASARLEWLDTLPDSFEEWSGTIKQPRTPTAGPFGPPSVWGARAPVFLTRGLLALDVGLSTRAIATSRTPGQEFLDQIADHVPQPPGAALAARTHRNAMSPEFVSKAWEATRSVNRTPQTLWQYMVGENRPYRPYYYDHEY